MSLGNWDLGPTPFIDFLFPLGKSLSTFVTQFPHCQMRKKPSEHPGRDGAAETQGFIQQVQLVFPTAAKRASGEEASSERFWFSGTKRSGGKEVILLC